MAGPGAASQLPSSLPHPAHGAERLGWSRATAPRRSAAVAGVSKDVTQAPLGLPPSAPLHETSTCTHAHRLKPPQTYISVCRDSQAGLSGGDLGWAGDLQGTLTVTAAAFGGRTGTGDTGTLLPLGAASLRQVEKGLALKLVSVGCAEQQRRSEVTYVGVSKMCALERERRTVVALQILAVLAAPRLSMSLPWTLVLNQKYFLIHAVHV